MDNKKGQILLGLLRFFRTYKWCQGVGCYVYTKDRNENGLAYCGCCTREKTPLKYQQGHG